jgi:predicted nucleotidyltransferase
VAGAAKIVNGVAFLSNAHAESDIDLIIAAYIRSFHEMRDTGLL